MENWIDETINGWKKTDVKMQSGIPIDYFIEFEKKLNFTFPDDFKKLYQKVNGFEYCDWNEHMFSLWSLERILEEFQSDKNENYIGFCDYLIHSHSIGFFKNREGIFINTEYDKICNTFEEFIGLLNSNSDLLY